MQRLTAGRAENPFPARSFAGTLVRRRRLSACLPVCRPRLLPVCRPPRAGHRRRRRRWHGHGRPRAGRNHVEIPIDISADGETTYDITPAGRVATATGGVSIQHQRREHLLRPRRVQPRHPQGPARRQRAHLPPRHRHLLADRAVYNFNTKSIRALDFTGTRPPFDFSGGRRVLARRQGAQYNLRNGRFHHRRFLQAGLPPARAPHPHLPGQPRHLHRLDALPRHDARFLFPVLLPVARPAERLPVHARVFEHQRRVPAHGPDLPHHRAPHRPRAGRLPLLARPGRRAELRIQAQPPRRHPRPRTRARHARTPATTIPAWPPSLGAPNASPRQRAVSGDNGAAQNGVTNGNVPATTRRRQHGYAPTGEALSRQIRNTEGATFAELLPARRQDRPQPHRARPSAHRSRPLPLALKGTQFFTDDLFFKVDLDKLSDRYLLQDFYEGEFTREPEPGQRRLLTYHQPTFVAALVGRAQVNEFLRHDRAAARADVRHAAPAAVATAVSSTRAANIGWVTCGARYDDTQPAARIRHVPAGHVPPVHLPEDALRLAERRAAPGLARDVLFAFRARRTAPRTTCNASTTTPPTPRCSTTNPATLEPVRPRAAQGAPAIHRRFQAAGRHRAAGGGRRRGGCPSSSRASTTTWRAARSGLDATPAHHPAVRGLLGGRGFRRRLAQAAPVRPPAADHAAPAHRLPAVQQHRLHRRGRPPCAWACATASRPSATR